MEKMAVSRRDFVALLLGAPAAMACRGGGRVRTPDGELLTPGKLAGHRLRDAVTVQSDAVRVQGAQPNVDVIVVGGGIA
ncbi:MAG TPA: hypothetical protein VM261_39345, partial [Kofleriaceae bacterium]|nr:hypothetical protein [Kofleriaceae bacterium]